MPLTAGTRLGPYEITTQLGAGGMGEVYKARDTRLGRDVALKILPDDVSTTRERRARFQQEARAVAALSHPNICAIYDVGSSDAKDYLVLELVDGESMAARLAHSPLPLPEALKAAREIATALAAAHRRGIVHRDLKPGNVMLTRTGAKVLDFGLAHLVNAEPAAAAVTMTAPLTADGTLMGTLPYMSPEQIEGQPVDARSDIFSFGSTFYEMLTGARAFDAKSNPGLVGAILRGDAPLLRSARPDFPASLDRLLRMCLQKRPDDRYESAHDIALELGRIASESESSGPVGLSPAAAPRSSWRLVAIGALVALVTVVAVISWRWWRPEPRQAASPFVFDVALPMDTVPYSGLALSPQGTVLVISARGVANGRTVALWVRELASATWRRIDGTDSGTYPFWSPDGTRLAFFTGDGKLKRVTYPNGAPVTICDVTDGRGGAWIDDRTIVFAPLTGGLMRVAADGGTPSVLVPVGDGVTTVRYPQRVDASRAIYFVLRGSDRPELRIVDVANPGTARSLVTSRTHGATDSGTLFYERDDALIGQPFDVGSGRLSGDPVRVPYETLATAGNLGYGQFSAAGGHVAVFNARPRMRQFLWVDRTGRRLATLGGIQDQLTQADLSRDGRRVAVSRIPSEQSGANLWIGDVDGGNFVRRTTGSFYDTTPVWNADGTAIAFRSNRGSVGNYDVFAVNADGPVEVRSVVQVPFGNVFPVDWVGSAGRLVWLNAFAPSLPTGLYMSDPGAAPTPYRQVSVNSARVSPDGRLIAWESPSSGQPEVYVDLFPTADGTPIRVSRGGSEPRWRSDGRELYYMTPDRRLMVVPVSAGILPSADSARPLFEMPAGSNLSGTADGARFLVLEPKTAAEYSVAVTLNWRAYAARGR